MKNPWLAAALAFFLFPFSAGYIYLKRWLDVAVWITIVWLLIAFDKSSFLVLIIPFTTWDCYRTAKKDNQKVMELAKETERKKKLANLEKNEIRGCCPL